MFKESAAQKFLTEKNLDNQYKVHFNIDEPTNAKNKKNKNRSVLVVTLTYLLFSDFINVQLYMHIIHVHFSEMI